MTRAGVGSSGEGSSPTVVGGTLPRHPRGPPAEQLKKVSVERNGFSWPWLRGSLTHHDEGSDTA